MEHKRKCISCGEIKSRDELIRIMSEYNSENVVVQPNSTTFGRSVYLCYNKSCIESACKKNRISKCLKASIPSELKGQLLNELRNKENK